MVHNFRIEIFLRFHFVENLVFRVENHQMDLKATQSGQLYGFFENAPLPLARSYASAGGVRDVTWHADFVCLHFNLCETFKCYIY